MPNLIKYSTSPQTLALKSGDYWIGTGDVPKGPTSSSDYWNGISPPVSGYTIYLNKASQGPSIYAPTNDDSLITLTNMIGSQSFTSVTQCFNWYNTQSDKMVFNRDYPEIITSGLVLNLDATFLPSYSTSGTTWYDLSPSGNNGTLTNGPTYSSSQGGSIVFDGTDDFSRTINASNFNNQNFTISVWVNPSAQVNSLVSLLDYSHSQVSNQGWVIQSEDATSNRYYYLAYYSVSAFQPAGNFGVGKGVQLTNSVWQYIVYTKNSSSVIGYKNGFQVFSATATNSTVTYLSNKDYYIANWNGTPSRSFKGNVANVLVYNRALTASEIQQNYNAQKSIFGL